MVPPCDPTSPSVVPPSILHPFQAPLLAELIMAMEPLFDANEFIDINASSFLVRERAIPLPSGRALAIAARLFAHALGTLALEVLGRARARKRIPNGVRIPDWANPLKLFRACGVGSVAEDVASDMVAVVAVGSVPANGIKRSRVFPRVEGHASAEIHASPEKRLRGLHCDLVPQDSRDLPSPITELRGLTSETAGATAQTCVHNLVLQVPQHATKGREVDVERGVIVLVLVPVDIEGKRRSAAWLQKGRVSRPVPMACADVIAATIAILLTRSSALARVVWHVPMATPQGQTRDWIDVHER
mmetsp:Transcript_81918/g.228313  ORF Transcript_81918/g.228313 Transcript_81918/m.228313 type:complete len:302 (+) Transcript_81918:180-1085(+)